MDRHRREAVIELLAVEPPQLRGLGDISALLRIDATRRPRTRARLGFADCDEHAVADKDRSCHQIEGRLRLAPGRRLLVRLAVEFPEQFPACRLKTVEPAISTRKCHLRLPGDN